jgi:hypothetical protein
MPEISLRKDKEGRRENLGGRLDRPDPRLNRPPEKLLQRLHIGSTDVVSEIPRNSRILDRELLSVVPP